MTNTSTPLGAYKREAICPECMQGHPVMDYPNEWQNAVRDALGHLTRGDAKDGELSVDSYPYQTGYKFAERVSKRTDWSPGEVGQELHEQQVYWLAIQGYNAFFEGK